MVWRSTHTEKSLIDAGRGGEGGSCGAEGGAAGRKPELRGGRRSCGAGRAGRAAGGTGTARAILHSGPDAPRPAPGALPFRVDQGLFGVVWRSTHTEKSLTTREGGAAGRGVPGSDGRKGGEPWAREGGPGRERRGARPCPGSPASTARRAGRAGRATGRKGARRGSEGRDAPGSRAAGGRGGAGARGGGYFGISAVRLKPSWTGASTARMTVCVTCAWRRPLLIPRPVQPLHETQTLSSPSGPRR